jgi:hypothetical protein
VRAGDRVELRAPAEILATLDDQACLEGVPFMPEMLGFFGRVFTVAAQVERACDTVNYSGVLRLRETVILDDLRCDGTGHAGCGAQCRLYWKEAWLRPASSEETGNDPLTGDAFARLQRLAVGSVHGADSTPEAPTFRCQATELIRAGQQVGWYRFARELTGGNVGLWRFARVTAGIVFQEIGRRLGLRKNAPFRPRQLKGQNFVAPAPRGLKPGQLVQVRSKREIAETLGNTGRNRGLWFDREMVPYCGRTARVKAKVDRFIDEGSGRMIELASDCYILDGFVCNSYKSVNRWFCPRAIYPWWRESWLRPAAPQPADAPQDAGAD